MHPMARRATGLFGIGAWESHDGLGQTLGWCACGVGLGTAVGHMAAHHITHCLFAAERLVLGDGRPSVYASPSDYCYDAIGLVACAQLLADKMPRANVTAEPTSRTFFSKRRKHRCAILASQTR
jgi:hypothetical protein